MYNQRLEKHLKNTEVCPAMRLNMGLNMKRLLLHLFTVFLVVLK